MTAAKRTKTGTARSREPYRALTPATCEATTTARVATISGTIAPMTTSSTLRPMRHRAAASCVSAAATSGRAMIRTKASTKGPNSTEPTNSASMKIHRYSGSRSIWAIISSGAAARRRSSSPPARPEKTMT